MKLHKQIGKINPFVAILYDHIDLTISFAKDEWKQVSALADTIHGLDDVDIEIKQHREKRSLEANSFLWVLCDKIADAVRSTKTEVYRKAIREVGVFHDMAVSEEDVPAVREVWESNGIGWFCDEFDSKLRGCKRMRFYHGSSLYDTKQMSRLIDYIVDEAQNLGIETRTPDEIEKIKNLWGDK